MPLCVDVWLLALWHLKPFCKPPQSPPTTSHPCLLRILPTSKNNNNRTWKQILLHQEDSLLSQFKDDCQQRVVYNNMLNLLSHYSHLHMVGKAFFCGTLEVYIKLFHVAETSHCWVAHIPFCALYAECDSGIKVEKEKKTLCLWQFMPLGLKFNWSKLKESRELMSFKNNFYPLTSFSQFSPYCLFFLMFFFLWIHTL